MFWVEPWLEEGEALADPLGFEVGGAREPPPLRPSICIILPDYLSLSLSLSVYTFVILHFRNRIEVLRQREWREGKKEREREHSKRGRGKWKYNWTSESREEEKKMRVAKQSRSENGSGRIGFHAVASFPRRVGDRPIRARFVNGPTCQLVCGPGLTGSLRRK